MSTLTSERTPTLAFVYLASERQTNNATRVRSWYTVFGEELSQPVRHAGPSLTARARPVAQEPVQARPAVSELGRRLHELRANIVAGGAPLLDWDGIEEEIAERRGEE